MHPSPHTPLPLPDADAIRSRIDELDEEAALLRRLLRVVIRIENRKPRSARQPADRREAAGV